ncbi:MAG: nitroreductase family protein [Candidatus Bipolaricaulota bacterium]|nr:MAG: nitroreductase family protein [Candidatus Bipolaricaulota bacterium]
MSDPLALFTQRRSVRDFTGEAIPRDSLETALRAAMAAPSGNNGKPWSFLVVTQPDTIKRLCDAHPYAKFGYEAGAMVIPFGEKEGKRWFDQDMGAATENFLLAIAALGLGATWCGMTEDLQEAIRPLVGLPGTQWAFALIPVGVPEERPTPRTQYEDERVHWERYRG